MRFSIRRVVKYSTFLLLIVVLNIWITYSVTLWTFSHVDGSVKVRKSLKLFRESNDGVYDEGSDFDVHGTERESNELNPRHLSIKTASLFRNQRSAKAVNSDYFIHTSENEIDVARQRTSPIPMQQVVEKRKHEGSKQLIKSIKHASKKSMKLSTKDKSLLNSSRTTDIEDIYLSVKTTFKYHKSRVKLLLTTWYRLASDQTFFFTDGNDEELSEILGDHLINTNCSTDHSRRALSCKMAVEFDFYLASRKRWFCHVDDDVYVNIPQLIHLLGKYNHKEDWYLGKPSLKYPLEVVDRENPGMKLAFWFATGGAGFCISRSLALKMAPYAGGGRFMTTAERIRLPDDCTLGYIIEYLLKKKLTVVNEFHSHLEALSLLKLHMLKDQITFSFSEYSNKKNVINIPGFKPKDDPTRLKSLHCFLFPTFRECRGLNTYTSMGS